MHKYNLIHLTLLSFEIFYYFLETVSTLIDYATRKKKQTQN